MNDNPNIKRGRKCRLTEEFKELFYNAFIKTGSIKESCEACGISIPTYNKWLAKYPEFKELVNKAKSDRLKSGVDELPDLKALAQEYVLDIFLGKKFKYKYKQVITKDGSVEELEEREQVIASDALIERALGRAENSDVNFNVTFGLTEPPNLEEEAIE
jgi:hypothetical protein